MDVEKRPAFGLVGIVAGQRAGGGVCVHGSHDAVGGFGGQTLTRVGHTFCFYRTSVVDLVPECILIMTHPSSSLDPHLDSDASFRSHGTGSFHDDHDSPADHADHAITSADHADHHAADSAATRRPVHHNRHHDTQDHINLPHAHHADLHQDGHSTTPATPGTPDPHDARYLLTPLNTPATPPEHDATADERVQNAVEGAAEYFRNPRVVRGRIPRRGGEISQGGLGTDFARADFARENSHGAAEAAPRSGPHPRADEGQLSAIVPGPLGNESADRVVSDGSSAGLGDVSESSFGTTPVELEDLHHLGTGGGTGGESWTQARRGRILVRTYEVLY